MCHLSDSPSHTFTIDKEVTWPEVKKIVVSVGDAVIDNILLGCDLPPKKGSDSMAGPSISFFDRRPPNPAVSERDGSTTPVGSEMDVEQIVVIMKTMPVQEASPAPVAFGVPGESAAALASTQSVESWSCLACTLVNDSKLWLMCDTCNTPRPGPRLRSSSRQKRREEVSKERNTT